MALLNFANSNAHIISDIKQTCIQIISIDVLTIFLKHFHTKIANGRLLKEGNLYKFTDFLNNVWANKGRI